MCGTCAARATAPCGRTAAEARAMEPKGDALAVKGLEV